MEPQPPSWAIPTCALVLVLAGAAAYSNSLSCEFVFDDNASISENASLRDLTDLRKVLSPPGGGATVQGRPLENLTLAINYAVGGLAPEGYHAVNVGIHVLAGLVLFGLVRRTLLLPGIPEGLSRRATALGFACALIWVVHPLATEAVTYLVQRCESLMALFYLSTLYCLVRGARSERRVAWYAAAVAACWLGVASKEVMVTVPVIALLYDRVYLTGSLRESLRQRRWLYVGLISSWGLLIWLMIGSGSRGGTIGWVSPSAWWEYARTQFIAIATYLRLCVVPYPLCFDYGAAVDTNPWHVWPSCVVAAAAFGATVGLLVRRPRMGFLLAAFFVILSPTTSVIPVISQSYGEHRMYLPLAAIVTAIVIGSCQVARASLAVGGGVLCAVAVTFGCLTALRNCDFSTDLSIWSDTVGKRPQNPRAQNDLGSALYVKGRLPEALERFQTAVRLDPRFVEARISLGLCLNRLGRPDEAVPHLQEALRLAPDNAAAHNTLGGSYEALGRTNDGIAQYREAIRCHPDYARAHENLGIALRGIGQKEEGLSELREAVRLAPDFPLARYNLGFALLAAEQYEEAVTQFDEAVRLDARNGASYYWRATAEAQLGREEAAERDLEKARALGYPPEGQ